MSPGARARARAPNQKRGTENARKTDRKIAVLTRDATALKTGLSLRSRNFFKIGPVFPRFPHGEIALLGPAGEP
jgi:hypothetical protein